RLNEETARNEARMEIALESVDTETMEIEANAEKLRARELVNQFKLEMGKDSKAKEDKTIDIEEPAKTEKESQKTVGKEKTKS
ncbi:MAG: PspA/IM30 family protein, partial [Balneolaceae bacterium]|nr:PspA/IM30 family protein [Balneolaceae bacterium]